MWAHELVAQRLQEQVWVLTIDQVHLGAPDQVESLKESTWTETSAAASLLPLDKPLQFTWENSNNNINDNKSHESMRWTGKATTSLVLPLEDAGVAATERTLIVALWQGDRRQLRARQVAQIPLTRPDEAISLVRVVPLEAVLDPATLFGQSRRTRPGSWGYRWWKAVRTLVGSLLVWVVVSVARGCFKKNAIELPEEEEEDDLWEGVEDDDYAQGDFDDAASQGEAGSQGDVGEAAFGDEVDSLSDDQASQDGLEGQVNDLDDPSAWALATTPRAEPRRPRLEEDSSAASSADSSGPALPPGVSRFVVRPLPSRGVTFQSEIERFSRLQVASPIQEIVVRRRHSPAVATMLASPSLDTLTWQASTFTAESATPRDSDEPVDAGEMSQPVETEAMYMASIDNPGGTDGVDAKPEAERVDAMSGVEASVPPGNMPETNPVPAVETFVERQDAKPPASIDEREPVSSETKETPPPTGGNASQSTSVDENTGPAAEKSEPKSLGVSSETIDSAEKVDEVLEQSGELVCATSIDIATGESNVEDDDSLVGLDTNDTMAQELTMESFRTELRTEDEQARGNTPKANSDGLPGSCEIEPMERDTSTVHTSDVPKVVRDEPLLHPIEETARNSEDSPLPPEEREVEEISKDTEAVTSDGQPLFDNPLYFHGERVDLSESSQEMVGGTTEEQHEKFDSPSETNPAHASLALPVKTTIYNQNSTGQIDDMGLPRVTPPCEKVLTEAARLVNPAAEAKTIDDFTSPFPPKALVRLCFDESDEDSEEGSETDDPPDPMSPALIGLLTAARMASSKPPNPMDALAESSAPEEEERTVAQAPASQQGVESSPTFTYVSTMSPDSRASSNWSGESGNKSLPVEGTPESGVKKMANKCDQSPALHLRRSPARRSPARPSRGVAEPTETSENKALTVDTADVRRVDVGAVGADTAKADKVDVGAVENAVEVLGVRPLTSGEVLPDSENATPLADGVYSHALRSVMQSLDSPEWRFSPEKEVTLKPMDGDAAEDFVEVVGVKPRSSEELLVDPEDANPLPDGVYSHSLRSAMQTLEAPVWQFSSEDALKPVPRKRRKSRRTPSRRESSSHKEYSSHKKSSTRKEASLKSPNGESSPRSSTKRKLVHSFATPPPPTEPGSQAKRHATGSSHDDHSTSKSQRSSKNSDPSSFADASTWSGSNASSRGTTFAKRSPKPDRRPPRSPSY
jgi:hypothetical protein